MSASNFCQEWLANLPKPEGIHSILQLKARESLSKVGSPENKNESWRVSNIKQLENFFQVPISSKIEYKYQDKYPILKQASNNIFQLIVNPIENPFESIELPKGINHLSKDQLIFHLGNALNNCDCDNEWPVLLNQCSVEKVLGLYIKDENLPVLEIIYPIQSNSFNSTRIILIIEDNAKLRLNQVIIGSKKSAHSNLIEMNIGKNADVNHGFIALGGGESNLLAHVVIEQEINSNYTFTSLQEGWNFSRLEPRILQKKGQASTAIKGLQIASKDEEVATHSFVRFDGPEGHLDQVNKATANGKSHSIFNGAIEVPRIAQKTQAAQLSRNLILSKRAKIDTKPELEIVADDVRCTHGATVSQLQEEELFYLRSRGIGSNEANSLLLEGYYKEILVNLPLYSERWTFLSHLLSQNKE